MATITDRQYFARFENRIETLTAGEPYEIHTITRIENVYYEFLGLPNPDANMTARVRITAYDPATESPTTAPNGSWVVFDPGNLGDGQFLSLEDIINNYIVLYADEDAHGGMPKRVKLEALAKRAIQEFSYDTFRVKDWEYTVGENARIPFPQDMVEFARLGWVDRYGIQRWLVPRKDNTNPRSTLQTEGRADSVWNPVLRYLPGQFVSIVDGSNTRYFRRTSVAPLTNPSPLTNSMEWTEITDIDDIPETSGFLYDEEGNQTFADNTSHSILQYDANSLRARGNANITPNLNNLSQYTTEGGFYTYGKRYYLDTETVNTNPTYIISTEDGAIDVDTSLIGYTIVLWYVSDGLSDDPAEINIPKFAEEAIYDSIYYDYIARKSDVPANEKERARRKMIAKRRQAKLRLSDITPRELLQTLRGQARWIKT